FDDEVRALILLSSLLESWNATVTAVSSSSGSNKLRFDIIQNLVLSEEIRRRELGEPSTSSVLHTESRERSSTKKSRHNKSKGRRSKSRNHRSSQNSKLIECWNCGKTEHYRNQCKQSKDESWVLDSGASFHATSQKELFKNYVLGNLGKVYLGNEQSCA
ncbi:Unknown protein, partial [Striga hermonthica]